MESEIQVFSACSCRTRHPQCLSATHSLCRRRAPCPCHTGPPGRLSGSGPAGRHCVALLPVTRAALVGVHPADLLVWARPAPAVAQGRPAGGPRHLDRALPFSTPGSASRGCGWALGHRKTWPSHSCEETLGCMDGAVWSPKGMEQCDAQWTTLCEPKIPGEGAPYLSFWKLLECNSSHSTVSEE